MSYYEKSEQETVYNYDPNDKLWRIYSTYPPDIRKILKRATIISAVEDESGRVIEVQATANRDQIRIYQTQKGASE